MQELIKYLDAVNDPRIEDTHELADILSRCWDQFDGGDDEAMAWRKLRDRELEDVDWDSPILRFIIERHGRTVLGSSRADLHQWELNIDERTATWSNAGHRQVRPMQPKVEVRPIAQEICDLIVSRQDDDRLTWRDDGSVAVRIGRIFPTDSGYKETVEGRRKRFRDALDKLMVEAGWTKIRANVYAPHRNGRRELRDDS